MKPPAPKPAITPIAPPRHRALQLEEPLLFEKKRGGCGVDIDPPPPVRSRLGKLARRRPVSLPGLSEPEAMRHFVRLSQKNYSIDSGIFPLGSCTMKHNPRLNEKVARLPGFAGLHPLQPLETAQGALELMHMLSAWLTTLCAMPAIALSPRAGAQGETCGMMAIRAALAARGEAQSRTRVLVPDSAHGTNPATAAMPGWKIDPVPAGPDGRLNLKVFREKLGPDVAALMLTNPNTCGLFERDSLKIAEALHQAGGFFYCDGANFNAIAGRVRPGDLGVDAMHINLHKTFSTPHGGGGPGAGPVVFSQALAPFAPLPVLRRENGGFRLIENPAEARKAGLSPCGRLTAFHGQMGMFVRALAYILAQGGDGLRQASGDAVLNANYILAQLKDTLSAPFPGPCMHEALFDDQFLEGTGLQTLDFAKAMIDEGLHPMTVYFPLVVRGAMLVEPTETESKASLDEFIATLRRLAERAQCEPERLKAAPVHAPRSRFDETQAARRPVLRWEGN